MAGLEVTRCSVKGGHQDMGTVLQCYRVLIPFAPGAAGRDRFSVWLYLAPVCGSFTYLLIDWLIE